MNEAAFRLRSLGPGSRLGLSGLIVVLLGGLVASAVFIYTHYRNRDEQPRLSITDFKGAYHGVTAPAPIVGALQRGHPPGLAAKDREALIDWLLGKKDASGVRPAGGNPRAAESFDDLDAGDANPADIIAKNCVSCHSPKASGSGPDADAARAIRLDGWENVKKVASAVQVQPTSTTGLLISTHAHALSLGTMGVVIGLLLLGTRFPRWLIGLLFALMGVGLLADIGGWWLARQYENAVYAILVGGAAFNGAAVVALVLTLLDLWLPRRP